MSHMIFLKFEKFQQKVILRYIELTLFHNIIVLINHILVLYINIVNVILLILLTRVFDNLKFFNKCDSKVYRFNL
jgi:hypothetical protein